MRQTYYIAWNPDMTEGVIVRDKYRIDAISDPAANHSGLVEALVELTRGETLVVETVDLDMSF